jgi:two-component system nitrate/nitrite sensor histidine kinase NarX
MREGLRSSMKTRQGWILLVGVTALLAADLFLGFKYGWVLAVGLLLTVSGWAVALRIRDLSLQHEREVLDSIHAERAAGESRRLGALMQLNHGLIEAPDEHSLMEMVLAAINGLVGAVGCSFVPVDEWEQPLPAFTYGKMPEPVLRAWANHLADHVLRARCSACSQLQSSPGGCPLHPEQAGSTMTVYCLPLERDGRRLGLLNLYLPAGNILDDSSRGFIHNLLPDIALAYESARLRSQEAATLRQLQMLHAPESDFSTSLGSLIEGLRRAIDADCVVVRLRPDRDERLAGLNIVRAVNTGGCPLPEEEVEEIFQRITSGEGRLRIPLSSCAGSLPAWMAVPLVPLGILANAGKDGNITTDGTIISGMLLVVVNSFQEFHPRQQVILQTVAAQVALLAENERLLRSLEYRVVIQERARLAREIHDGLAQTLAFLKLQSAQMQSYLAQGDLHRLSQVLSDNYQALAEAYLDTRQSIDNLRINPQEGVDTWLARTLADFESTTGIKVERNIFPLGLKVALEIQAQLIRVVQESLSNVRKHARARQVWISLRVWEGTLILEVRDDGQGFDAEDIPEVSRHGLRGMRERAEMIGADFQVISQPGAGTTVVLSLPLPMEEESPL